MLKIETIAKNFKIFWSLQVRTSVYAYTVGRYAPASSFKISTSHSRNVTSERSHVHKIN